MSGHTRGSERGLALVSVLWALSILSLIAASMISTGSVSTMIERNALKRAQAGAIADAGIILGIAALLDSSPEKHRRIDGVPQKISFHGVQIEVSIQDEFGLIDLNEANVSLLAGLFRSAGLAPDAARRVAAGVVDWRTGGNSRSLDGADRSDYRAAGLSYAPRDAPLQTVDELRLVLGMTQETFTRVVPALTVHAHQPNADNRTAPKEALLAQQGMNANEVNEILAARLSVPSNDAALSLNGRAFSFRADLTYRGSRVRREAIIRFTGDREHTYLVLVSE